MAAMKSIPPTTQRAMARFGGRWAAGGSRRWADGSGSTGTGPFPVVGRTTTCSPQRGQDTLPAIGSVTGTAALQYGQAVVGMAFLVRGCAAYPDGPATTAL